MASNYKTKTKEELQMQLAEASKALFAKNEELIKFNTEKVEMIEKYEGRIKELENEVKKVKSSKEMFSDIKDKESKQKFIIKLRAKLWQSQKIFDYVRNNAIDGIDMDLIENTIENLDLEDGNLSPSMLAYYRQERDIFLKEIKMNKEEMKKMIYDSTLESLDIINKKIRNCDDDLQLKIWLERKNAETKTLNSLINNMNEEELNDTANIQMEKINSTMDSYRNNSKILFKPKIVRKVENE